MAIINGTSGDDVLTGTTANDTVNGLDGNDTLRGGGGQDTLNGGAGDDLLLQDFSEDSTLDGGDGRDTARFVGGILTESLVVDLSKGIATWTNVEQIPFFGPGLRQHTDTLKSIETVEGSANADTLIGGALDDILIGGLGKDTLTGGGGADTFVFRATYEIRSDGLLTGNVDSRASAIDSITDFQTGADRLDLTGLQGLSAVALVRSGSGTLVFGQSTIGQVTTGADLQTVIGVNGIIQGADVFVNSVNPSVQMVGDDRNDTLIGGSGNDQLFGLGGSDTLNGGAGDDQLFGDAGADVLIGGPGADRFAYRGVSDSNARDGYDIITDFVSGTDRLDFSYLTGVQSVALVRSGDGTIVFASTPTGQVEVGLTGVVQSGDLINPTGSAASFGYDVVGSGLNELLIGSPGDDRIFGLGGSDTINGGAGNDLLYGDAGADLLTGGPGADVFAYRGAADSPLSGFDRITDFQTGVDKIDLRAIHTSAADKYGIAYQNGDALLFLDQGGDGSSEFLIVLQGVTSVQASDIVF